MIAFQFEPPPPPPPKVKALMLGHEDIAPLKKLCKNTPKGGMFEYKGGALLKEYAEYVVEFLESKFK